MMPGMGSIEARETVLKGGARCFVRPAEIRDAGALLALTRAVLEEPGSRSMVTTAQEFDLTLAKEQAWIEEHREKGGWLVLVAEVDVQVVGLIDFKTGPRRRLAHRGALGMLVAASWRGQGVGDTLLASLLDWATAHPRIEKVGLSVIDGNEPALGLYRKYGFVEEGRRPREIRYGADRYADDILMYRLVGGAP